MSPVATRLIRGSAWSLAGSVTSRILALLAAVVAARALGKASYGQLGIIQSTVGMFGTLAGFGMGTTATKCVAEYRMRDKVRAGNALGLSSVVSWGMSSVLAVALVVSAPWLAEKGLAAPGLTPYLRLSALLLLLNGVGGAQTGALAGFEAFRSIARISAVTGLFSFACVAIGAVFYGLTGVVLGLICAQAMTCILSTIAVRGEAREHEIRVSYASWKSEASVLWRFSVPAVLGSLLVSPVTWACNAMLVRLPDGYSQMGALSAATQWFGALTWLPYTLSSVTLPMLSERIGASDNVRSSKLLRAAVSLNAVIILPLVVMGSLLSPLVMAAYGEGFRSEWPTLVAMLVAAGLASVQVPIGGMIAASDRMWTGFVLNLGWSVALVGATYLLVERGSFGLACAQALAYGVQAAGAFAFARGALRGAVREV